MPSPREAYIGFRNILLGGGLASARMWRNPSRWAVSSTEVLAIWDALLDRKGLPLKSVTETLNARGPITLTLWDPPMGAIAGRTVDLLALCQLSAILEPTAAFEIGTLHGQTALHFAMNGADKVYTLDLPPEQTSSTLVTTSFDRIHQQEHGDIRLDFQGTEWESRITCLYGDSATFDYSAFKSGIDLFFIDGAHSFEYVRSDTLKALYCLRPGGVLAWHDFGRRGLNGVSKWLRQLNRLLPIAALPGGSLAFAKVEDPGGALASCERWGG